MMITTTGHLAKLTYRVYKDIDMQNVLELWEKYSEWGKITEHQFQKWYINTPYGRCLIIISVDEENKVVGQIVFVPSLICIEGKEAKALRASAPILHESIRQKNIKDYHHPVFAMFRYGMEVAKQQGYSLVYLFPALAWTSVLRLFPRFNLPDVQVSAFDCFSISLVIKDTYSYNKNHLLVEIHTGEFNNEYDKLWDETVEQLRYNCIVTRKSLWLNWKIRGFFVLEIRCPQKLTLVGYIAINKTSGLIVDMLARTEEDLSQILSAVIQHTHSLNPSRIPVTWTEIKGMYTPLFQSILQNTKHELKNFRFGFACYPLDKSINDTAIQPTSWFMMPND